MSAQYCQSSRNVVYITVTLAEEFPPNVVYITATLSEEFYINYPQHCVPLMLFSHVIADELTCFIFPLQSFSLTLTVGEG